MSTYLKYSISYPSFSVKNNTQGILTDGSKTIYLGFEDEAGNFIGNNTIANSTALTSTGDGGKVFIYYTDSNTASVMLYSATKTGYYTISYNGKQLFILNVVANTTTKIYNLYLSLINLSSASVSNEISYIAIFTKNVGNFNVQGTITFNLMQVTVYNKYIFFCYSPDYTLTYNTYKNSAITYKSGTNYSTSTYGNCYLVDITKAVAYTDTTGYNKENITYTNTYYIYRYDGGYMQYVTSFNIYNDNNIYTISVTS